MGTLAASYDRCRELHRAHGRTYYLATRLLPRWKRRHVHALYGFSRYTDDLVDRDEGSPPDQRAARLRQWTDRFTAALADAPFSAAAGDGAQLGVNIGARRRPPVPTVDDPILPAVLHTIEVFHLDHADFFAFLRSMEMDLSIGEYDTYEDLLEYMAGSAAAIGSMMLPILGSENLPRAREPARQLGLAFQLTNFIRDVGEDLDRGRIYLPRKDLAEFGVTPDELRAKTVTGPIRRLLAFEVDRARGHYARAAVGIPLLEASSQGCIRAAYRLYGGILGEVVAAGYDVFSARATVPNRRRLAVAAGCLLTAPGRPETADPCAP